MTGMKWLHEGWTGMRKIPKPGAAAAAAAAVGMLLIVLLFTKPYAGMADNGDYFREIHNPGLYYLTDSFEDRHFGYFNREFGIREYPYDPNSRFVSSLSLMIRAALGIDLAITGDNRFDLRFLAALYSVLFLAAVYLIVKEAASRLKPGMAAFAAAAAAFILADTGYTVYFNSFYGEPASYIFLLLSLVLMMRLPERKAGWTAWFIAWAACAVLFAAAKQQNAPAGILFALMGLRLSFRMDKGKWRRAALAGTAAIAAASVGVYLFMTDDIKHINQYHAVTRGILEGSLNPERDLKELGLDPKFAVLAGTTYYDKYQLEPVESPLMEKEFYSKFGYGTIIGYYLRHADRAFEKLDMAASQAYSIRPDAMGNYEKSAGKPYGAKTAFFSGWSSLKKSLFPDGFRFILLYYGVYYGGLAFYYARAWRRRRHADLFRLEVMALPGVIGLSQLAIAFLGAGDADLAKHLFLFNVCFDLMFGVMLVHAVRRLAGWLTIRWKAGMHRWKSRNSISG